MSEKMAAKQPVGRTAAESRQSTPEGSTLEFADHRPDAARQRRIADSIHASPRMAAQRRKADRIQGAARPVVQRDVMDDTDASKILLDRFNRPEEAIQVITAALYGKLWRSGQLGETSFDALYEQVASAYSGISAVVQDPKQRVSISQLVETQFKVHENWLKSQGKSQLAPHEASLRRDQQKYFAHYNAFDQNMLWRFTSRPSSESVHIAAGTSHETIAKVVAAHSGGNDKSNPDVKTLSFGRNLGALIGVAASTGGDKHVLNIADKAEYLYGIDIGSLASQGISAHPATARMISLFETEYVLVCTPGDKPRTLDALANVKYRNPFKATAIDEMLGQDRAKKMGGVEKEMGTVEPEQASGVTDMDQKMAEQILAYARRAARAASEQSFAVQDKEPIRGQQQIESSMGKYHTALNR